MITLACWSVSLDLRIGWEVSHGTTWLFICLLHIHASYLTRLHLHAWHLTRLHVLHRHAWHLPRLHVLHRHTWHLTRLHVLHRHAWHLTLWHLHSSRNLPRLRHHSRLLHAWLLDKAGHTWLLLNELWLCHLRSCLTSQWITWRILSSWSPTATWVCYASWSLIQILHLVFLHIYSN